jgi:hypothetical protein
LKNRQKFLFNQELVRADFALGAWLVSWHK